MAPTSAPVPDSAAGSQRTCRNAPARVAFEGRPKYAAFSVVSGTSLVVPSIDTTRSPQQNTPAAPTGPALESKGTDTRRVAARSTLHGRGRGRGRAWRAVVTADRTLSLQLGWLPPALAG